MKTFDICVAINDADGGIGCNGAIPWHIPHDLQRFKEMTLQSGSELLNAIIMGRKTWDSLPKRPLPGRINIVLSKTVQQIPGAVVFPSLESALEFVDRDSKFIDRVFVIGGASIYTEALASQRLKHVFVTRVFPKSDALVSTCDTFFPKETLKRFTLLETSLVHTDSRYVDYLFQKYERPDAA